MSLWLAFAPHLGSNVQVGDEGLCFRGVLRSVLLRADGSLHASFEDHSTVTVPALKECA